MKELWSTGWMHNRVRMIVASFLVKDLLIPWQEGARWFWDTLVDADLANNTLGWQWSAGCGADAAPYFRIGRISESAHHPRLGGSLALPLAIGRPGGRGSRRAANMRRVKTVMAREKILVVEDEEDILELIKYNLTKEGYQVSTSTTGESAIETARRVVPDLILLDVMLPGMDGLEVCRLLKRDPVTEKIPIIMLTAKGEESDIITGLEIGADDYMPKPFSPKVVIARIRNLLRRKSRTEVDDSSTIKIKDLTIHPGRHEVLIKTKKVDLTFTEFRVLQFLARRPGWVYTRQQIVDAVRGEDYPVTDRSVDVQIVGLRRKLGTTYGELIETVRGVGYRFQE
jgi:two-component system alkaline phosphatase synthesis response regulator PhoP